MAHEQIQPEPHPGPGAAGFYGNAAKHDDHDLPETVADKTGAGIQVSSENEQNAITPNETLNQVAESKGRWFQYVKTKQFWVTLLLGQGKIPPVLLPRNLPRRPVADHILTCSPGDLYHLHQHTLHASQQRRHLDSRIPIILQLRLAQPDLHHIHNLQVRLQALGSPLRLRRMALLHPSFLRRRGQLLRRPRIPIRKSPCTQFPLTLGTNLPTQKTDYNPQRAVDQLLGYCNRRRHLLPLPARALPLHANLWHLAMHRRSRRHFWIRPHYRRQQLWRQRSCQRRLVRASWSNVLWTEQCV
jgi:hypothetical protein